MSRMGWVDLDTGEILGEYKTQGRAEDTEMGQQLHTHQDLKASARRNVKRGERQGEHVRLYQEPMKRFRKTGGYRPVFADVLLVLLCATKYEERVMLTTPQIADESGHNLRTVQRAIKHMIDNGVIEKREYQGVMRYYFKQDHFQKGRKIPLETLKIARGIQKETQEREEEARVMARLEARAAAEKAANRAHLSVVT